MKIGAIILFIILPLTSLAQISIGVKGGLNVTSLEALQYASNTSSFETQVRPGFHFGLFTRVPIVKKIYFSPEIQFVQKGNFVFDSKSNLNFLEFPLMISYMPIKIIELQAGMNLALNLASNSNYNSLISGLAAGVIVNVSSKIFLVGRYCYDVSPVGNLKSVGNLVVSESKINGWSIQASVGYRIK
jgi:Outer membrane protein beta-barrel domain